MVAEKRCHRRDHAQRLDEGIPERPERSLVEGVEAAAGTADGPVGDVVDEGLERPDHVAGQRRLVAGGRVGDKPLRALDKPTVERRQLAGRLQRVPGRREAFDVRVVDEEPDRVPERQQPPFDLVGWAEAEQQVAVRRLRAILPAHDVGAHLRERLLRVDRVAPRAMHLAAFLVEHLLVAEHPPVRRPAHEHDRHEELRVEPEPDLFAHLRYPVGREPLLPVRVIGQVAVVSPLAAPVPNPCGMRSGFSQPSVASGTMPASSHPTLDLRDPRHRLAA